MINLPEFQRRYIKCSFVEFLLVINGAVFLRNDVTSPCYTCVGQRVSLMTYEHAYSRDKSPLMVVF